MNILLMFRWAAPIVLSTGCAQPAREIFASVGPAPVWPDPPERPRIRYLGQIRNSTDLHPAKTGWQVLREALNRTEYRPIPLTTPHAVACGLDGRIYVVDPGSASLHILDLTRRTHVRVDSAGGEKLRNPAGVAVTSSSVFVTDSVLGDVLEYSLAGEFRRRLGLDLQRPGGIAFCPSTDRLYVVDTAAHRVVAVRTSGEVAFTFGERGVGSGQFNFPTHIACSPLLGLLVSDTLNFRVQRFDTDGTFVSSIGKKGDGAGDFSLPKGVAVDREGRLCVIDAHFENMQLFRADGQLLLAIGEEGNGPGQFAIPSGVAIDQQDRIWVADAHNRRLQVFQFLREP